MKAISLTVKTNEMFSFFPMLQHGVMLKTRVGCSVKTLLCENCGVSPAYVEDRIKTIFLDGQPVDDIDTAILRDGSSLALSAAMPGLVGSTFRRGSHLAAFRSTITHQKADTPAQVQDGLITLKLFNLLLRELGPGFLERGVWIGKDTLEDFLKTQPAEFLQQCRMVSADVRETMPDDPANIHFSDAEPLVLLSAILLAPEKQANAAARTESLTVLKSVPGDY
ncbi:MAG: hypothetical protein B6245_06325 [Desulfobacteraceae bacterium 4572_88]|nr:MAG: hypothetical protein B6245_06325 [Desulfobacteraceae bacterium 4572_88]